MSFYHRFRPLHPAVGSLLGRSTCQVTLQKRSVFEQTRSGSMELERRKLAKWNEKTEIEKFKLVAKQMKHDLKWAWASWKENVLMSGSSDNKRGFSFADQEVVKFWDFDQSNNEKLSSYPLEYKEDKTNDMKNWYCTCDAEYDSGFSNCSWTTSPAGYGLFSGYLDKTVPKDGKVVRSGFAYLGSIKARNPFNWPMIVPHAIFGKFTHVVLRVRGDGRRYFVIFDTSDFLDITWFDRYQFMLYTHGGPYWQYVKIPLNRFYFHYQGFVQDNQYLMQPDMINNVGILVHDIFPGAFRLEIDYVGFMCDTQYLDTNEYEAYFIESSPFRTLGSV